MNRIRLHHASKLGILMTMFALLVLTGCAGFMAGDRSASEAPAADIGQPAPRRERAPVASDGGAAASGDAAMVVPPRAAMSDEDVAEDEAGEVGAPAMGVAPDASGAAAQAPANMESHDSLYLQRGSSASRPDQPELPRRPRTPQDMTFDDAGVNPWRQTERDALSTFAVDVDTGSYPLVRRYLADDLLPPVAAVRPEEVLNYFGEAYDYAPPLLGTFAVHVDGAPSPFDRREHVLRIGIKGREVRDRARKPLALTLVIDVSGSMEEGGRLELVKDGLIHLVEQLAEEDDLAIVAYSTNARVVLERRAMDSREARREAMDAIDSLRPSNSTNAEAGLMLAYDLADEGWRKEAVNKVVLASDGVANVGATGPGTILDRIGDYVRREITLTAIGVGMGNYNDALLEQLADRGDGSYHYIDDYTEMRRVMVDGLVSTLQTIALDAKVQVEFDPENVYAWRLIGYENRDVADRDFTNDRVDAGEIGAGQSVTALYAIELERGPRGTLATVRVRWQDPDGGPVDEIDERVTVNAITDDFDDASQGLRLATAAAGFAELLRDGDWARTARFDEVADIAMRVSDERERVRDDEVAELARLAERAGWLRGGVGYGGRIDEGERWPEEDDRRWRDRE